MKYKLLIFISLLVVSGVMCMGCSTQNTSEDSKATTQTITQVTTDTATLPSTAEQTTEQTTAVYTEPATEKTTDMNKYIGLYEFNPNNEGNTGSIKVGILSIDESTAEIEVIKSSTNYTRLVGGIFSGSVTDENRIEFTMTDNFANVCSGYILLNDDSIYMKSDVVEEADPYYYGMIIDNTIEKVSDKVSKDDFI